MRKQLLEQAMNRGQRSVEACMYMQIVFILMYWHVCVCRDAKRGRTFEHSSEAPREPGEERGGKGNILPLTQEQNTRIQQLKAQVNNVFRQERITMGGLSKSV